MTHTTKLLSLFLLAGVFAMGTLQPATAQTASHGATVDVASVNILSVSGAPSITINSGELNTWVAGGGAGSFKVTSNAQTDRKLDVTNLGQNNGVDLTNLGLRVTADATPGSGNAVYSSGGLVLTSKGSGTLATTSLGFISGFQTVYQNSNGLTYEANANASYDPAATTSISVEYTMTAN